MVNTQNKQQVNQTDDFFRIQDLVYLSLANWKWFLLSLFITSSVAAVYLLSTPAVYQRTASVLVKEDSKSQSISSDVTSMFSDLGLSQGQSNVYNELSAMQAPAVLLETVKRLALDVDYQVQGTFHKETLYGNELPVKVVFHDLTDEESARMTVKLKDEKYIEMFDFKKSDNDSIADSPVMVELNTVADTPLGKLSVVPTESYESYLNGSNEELYVIRTNLYDMTDKVKENLFVAISNEKSTLIEISYKDVLAQRASDVINTIIAVYKGNWMKDKNQMTVATSNFITERLGVIEHELGDVDENISSYKSSHLLPDVETASNLYMTQSKETNSQILQLSTQRSMAQYVRGYLTRGVKSNQLLPANSGIESSSIEAQITEYNSMQLQRNSLIANSSENNPLVQDLDQSLASMRKAIVTSIDNLVVTLNTQIQHLRADEQRINTQIASNPDQAKYLQSIGRQQKVKEALYLFLLQKREENELSQAFTAYNTRIISPPSGKLQPVAPVTRNIVLVAIALGLLVPLVVLFIRENMSTTVRGRKDLENVSVPFVGEIPQFIRKEKGWFGLTKKAKEVKAIVVKEGSRDIINEAFRVLRTNLEFMTDKESRSNVIVVTSFNPGSGKSFLTMNIATSFAIKGKKILVIDGDMRHGSSSAYIDSPQPGLSDYLSGRVDNLTEIIYVDKNYENLSVIPIGTIPPNPTELLFNDRLVEMITTVRDQYDYVFIDCPPIELVADTQIIEKLADRTVFVVRAGLLERSMLSELENIYNEKKYKNMALVLNGTEGASGRYGYKYGYRYGYHYGYGYSYQYGSELRGEGK